MIDDHLVKTVQCYIANDDDLNPELTQELLNNYTTMIESDAELRKRLAQFNSAFNTIGAHIQKSSPEFTMGGVDGNDIFSSSGAIIEYIEKLESNG